MNTLVGVLLILAGVVGLLLGGMGSPQDTTPALDAVAAQNGGLPLAMLGGLTLVCGIGLLIRGRRH